MSNATPNHAALNRTTPAEWIARREESIKRIAAALAEGPMTIADLADEFNMSANTLHGHMTYMAERGLAHRTGKRDGNRRLWAKGPKPVAVEAPEHEGADEGRTKIAKAQQIGVQRDPWVAALFGPAQTA